MEPEDVLAWFALGRIGALGLALKLSFETRALRVGHAALSDRVQRLDAQLQRLGPSLPASQLDTEPAVPSISVSQSLTAAEPAVAPAPEGPEPAAIPTPAPARLGKGWEQALAENWLVWLGGLALALGGGFLVKLSIDYGLLTPTVRVVLGVLLGVGLALGADWVARREPATGLDQTASSYVPQALAAAGSVTVFASLLAAYQLYDLLSATLAFPLLAATAGATVVMSLRHGPLVAALGLVGAYFVPLLVESDTPQALPLFGYLALVTAASLALLRHRTWWWLAWLSLAGAVFWVLLWLGNAAEQPQTPLVGGFLVVQLALFGAFRRGIDQVNFLAGVSDAPTVPILTRAAFWVIAALIVVLVHVDGFGAAGLTVGLLAAVFFLWFGYRDARLDDVIAISGALLLALLATWNLPLPSIQPEALLYPRAPAEATTFSTVAVLSALLLGGGGFLMLRRVPRPGRWAALSAAAPALILVIGYWRLRGFAIDIGWSGAALALGGLELAAAAAVARQAYGRDGDRDCARRLRRRCARGDDSRRDLRALQCVADGCLGASPAGAGLGRRSYPPACVALARARRGCDRADPADAQPLATRLSALRHPDLQLAALRLWRACAGVHRRDAAVRRASGRRAGSSSGEWQHRIFDDAADPGAAACALWPARRSVERSRTRRDPDITLARSRSAAVVARRAASEVGAELGRHHPVRAGDRPGGDLAGRRWQPAVYWRPGRPPGGPGRADARLRPAGVALCGNRVVAPWSHRAAVGGADRRRWLCIAMADPRNPPPLSRPDIDLGRMW
jgi:predicted membrane protein DUF2339